MGYNTVFEGVFNIDKPLDDETYELLWGLASTFRIKREPAVLEQLGYGKVESFGVDGEFFVNPDPEKEWYQCPEVACYFSNSDYFSSPDYYALPNGQPSRRLKWVPTDDRRGIVWSQSEKFYKSDLWIKYLIDRILRPRGYTINGTINAQGDSEDDQWHLHIVNNEVEVNKGFSDKAGIPDILAWRQEAYGITVR